MKKRRIVFRDPREGFQIGTLVRLKGTCMVGKVVYANPDHRLYEVAFPNSDGWPQMYSPGRLEAVQ